VSRIGAPHTRKQRYLSRNPKRSGGGCGREIQHGIKSLSQVHNMKLAVLAQQIVDDFSEMGNDAITTRSRFDQCLLTAHLRARGPADGRKNSTV
jgi:hypothetical protein